MSAPARHSIFETFLRGGARFSRFQPGVALPLRSQRHPISVRALLLLSALCFLVGMSLTGCDSNGIDSVGCSPSLPSCTAWGDVALGDGTTASELGLPLVLAVFSTSDHLADASVFQRVTGATDAGEDVATPLTVPSDLDTDIHQDFDATDTCVTVPHDAEYVFFSAFDGYFDGNEALYDYGVVVQKQD